MNFEKLKKLYCWTIFIILFTGIESVSAQYYLSGPTTVYEGSYEYYSITGINGQEPSDSYFTWSSTVGVLEGSDGYEQLSMALTFDVPRSGVITASWYDPFTYQYYYASTTVEVKKRLNPETPSALTVVSTDCNNTVLQRGTPPAGETWYWQNTSDGTSTSDTSLTKTVPNGATYYLRARDNNTLLWSFSSSSIYLERISVPVVGTITQPTLFNSTGSVVLSGLPSSNNWVINPGNITGNGTTKLITGLAASTTYNFTVTNASGCTSGSSTNVVINASPSVLDLPILSGVTHANTTTNIGSFTITNYNPSFIYTVSPTEGVIFSGATVTAPPGSYSIVASFQGKISPSASVTVNAQSIVCGGISNENYIHTTIPQIETTDISSLSNVEKQESVTYFDGLGRPIQKIGIRAGGGTSSKDIITHIAYDNFDRVAKEYLPYTDDASCGMFRTGDIDILTKSFYNTSKYENTINPYSEKQFEASPLNRVLKQAAPGNDWALGNGHEIKMDYKSNLDIDEVKKIKVVLASSMISNTVTYQPELQNTGSYYSENELYKTVTYDENSATNPINESAGSTVEFKNKEGQVVLKRTYGTVEKGSVNEKHDTYYIYDDLGNLSFVIPPKAVDLIGNGTIQQSSLNSTAVVSSGNTLNLTASNSITLKDGFYAQSGSTFSAVISSSGSSSVLDDLCYQYKYDQRNRLVEKKLPGKQWEFIVYDKLDRVVATGPALSPFNDTAAGAVGWMITKYDVFSRPVYTGWEQSTTVNSVGRIAKQTAQNSTSVFNESKQTSGTIDSISVYYSNAIAPTSFKLLKVNYYNNYDFPGVAGIPSAVETQNVISAPARVKGLATGSWTRVPTTLLASQSEIATTFYDNKARPVRTYSTNFLGGYTFTDTKLDFTGKPDYTISYHKRLSTDTELKTKDIFTYSPQGRLLTHKHQINDGTEELIASNAYDELGQLVSKKIGNNVATPTQKVDYTYNIRGWLKGINDISVLQQGSDPKDLFAFKINYNNIPSLISGVTALYNGNIAETQWATNSDNGVVRTYGYKYDNLNRLREGIYKKEATVTNLYNESMDYDKNGNIMHLTRYGSLDDTNQTLIDNLTYNYLNNNTTNQLLSVDDAISNNPNFANEFKNTSGNDYTYDANGNMLTDANKGITTNIVYNHLNLPTKITFGTAGNIVYIYNASGQKVRKEVTQGSITTTDYLGGYQYKDNDLKFFPTAEGYVEHNASSYKYIYQYKDHLGNIRLSYDKNLVVQEENDYYPFGLKHTGYGYGQVVNSDYKYKYNGKELQDENIGGIQLNLYDYGARNYDPALGRWMNVDPLAEKYYNYSLYSYVGNMPTIAIDPDGKKIVFAKGVSKEFKAAFAKAIKHLNKHNLGGIYAKLQARKEIITIAELSKDQVENGSYFDPDTKTINWDPNRGLLTNKGIMISATTILNHEGDHALEELTNKKQKDINKSTKDKDYDNLEEKRVIEGTEQLTAKALGEIQDGEVTRMDHGGIEMKETKDPTSTSAKNEVIIKAKKKKNEEQ
ncbi:RHS repeat-associated core domain-containing protein [Flavobacterium seoulense]|uniref:DUF6443 domain-containing protein n=1 Tax=Flavobacterium seoulense TaxID=1492738 RepID=A0A066WT12_9FLAO|nr:RHS repeat-associated core domain-containing protein [Flavobacterium seoulense]KDN55708.1 hypothetical protein FEM21_13100 [Flavobacterium seoulense]